MSLIINAVGVVLLIAQGWRQPTLGYMCSVWFNAVGVMPIFQWMYFTIYMPSWCNLVRVVLLIARGWRGTSLPRVNIRKEIQRHRC